MSSTLLIHQTWGSIRISQSFARMNVQQKTADLEIRQQPATLDIQTERGKLSIDQSAPFAEEGLATSGQLARQFAQDGQQAVLDYIKKKAEEGDRLAREIQNGNVIADLAVENSRPPTHDFNVGLIPRSPVHFSYQPAVVRTSVFLHRPEVQVQAHAVHAQVIPGNVQIQMAQYPSITIQVSGERIDRSV
ncbi:hypothetical protein DNHGIG_10520 [Collibacillus ludicampi]|uniref:DUF2382 domain-containing protein n=1 Tax=Collibacillus ludicampi TaxID=2771369 RepID=A0AAV4LCK6_9BACL|nr:DUF6470 family protein [Collibacillus ludicampi]GIM45503.1 hypothetical protein DNHGIG_10520 [Collibacillus ludicampi]